MAATLPVLVLSTMALSYYPHGTLAGLGVEAALLAGLGASQEVPDPMVQAELEPSTRG